MATNETQNFAANNKAVSTIMRANRDDALNAAAKARVMKQQAQIRKEVRERLEREGPFIKTYQSV